jgi:hypothetical protein
MIKKILTLGIFVGLSFSGCYEKQPTIHIKKEPKIKVKKVKIIKKEIKKKPTKQELEAIENEKKMKLKKKLDKEAVTNASKTLKVDEVRDYTIDENTPLILKNKSEEKAYE